MNYEHGGIQSPQEFETSRITPTEAALPNKEGIDFATEAVVAFELGLDQDGKYIDPQTGASNQTVVENFSRLKYGDLDAVTFFASHLATRALQDERFMSFMRDAEAQGRATYITSPGIFNVPSASNLLLKASAEHLNIGLAKQDVSPVIVAEQTRLGESVITYASKTAEERATHPAPRSIIPEKFHEQSVIFLDDLFNTGTVANRAKQRLEDEVKAADTFYLFGAKVDEQAVIDSDGTVEDRINNVVVTGTLESVAPILQKDNFAVVQKLLQVTLNPKNIDQLDDFLQTIPTVSLLKLHSAAAANDYRRRYEQKFAPSITILEETLQERGALDSEGHLIVAKKGKAKVEYEPGQEPYRIALHAIDRPEDVPSDFGFHYSRMKYGDPEAVAFMAESVAEKFLSDEKIQEVLSRGETVLIAGSAYKEVPTAAGVIAREVVQLLQDRGIAVDNFKINVGSGFSVTNYGAMNKEEREACLKTISYDIDEENQEKVAGKTVIVIDDLNATGAHEKIFNDLLNQTQAKEKIFGYLIDFSDRLAAEGAHAEDVINHSNLKTIYDLTGVLKEPEDPTSEVVINARTIKFILTSGEKNDLKPLLEQLEESVLQKLYDAATASDGYATMPTMIKGFQILENYLLENGILDLETVNNRRGRVTIANVTIDAEGNFTDMETGEEMNEFMAAYSRMKYGSVPDIKMFGQLFADRFIASLDDTNSVLMKHFEDAKDNGSYVTFVTPGTRNVEHGSAFAYEEAMKRINVELALRGLPTIVPVKLTRLEAVTGDYAKLEKSDRQTISPATDHILPNGELYQFGVHMIFGDDVRITGTTADAVERSAIQHRALSYTDMYDIVIDPTIAANNPAVENFLNHTAVTGKLNDTLTDVVNHPEFRPVQRLLRMLFQEDNRETLADFCAENISNESLIKLYISSLGNDFLRDPKYAPSLEIMRSVMEQKGLVNTEGRLLPQITR